jgi:hypothetical protein
MDSCDFGALYRDGRREIAVLSGSSFGSFVNVDIELSKIDTYVLRNRASLIVEEGIVAEAGSGPRPSPRSWQATSAPRRR